MKITESGRFFRFLSTFYLAHLIRFLGLKLPPSPPITQEQIVRAPRKVGELLHVLGEIQTHALTCHTPKISLVNRLIWPLASVG